MVSKISEMLVIKMDRDTIDEGVAITAAISDQRSAIRNGGCSS